jgi:GT2 family glycosyltransferase
MRPIDIIVCTFNNAEFLNPCVESIVRTGILADMATLHIVNNGKQDIKTLVGHLENIVVHEPGENLGWEGGLEYALKRSTAPFVVFQNDDTFIPRSSYTMYQKLLISFANDEVGAVGPTTTVAAGLQSIYHPRTPMVLTSVSYLIFFTVMVRRKYLEEVGGIDTTLPGGDDFDLSMRLRKAGKVCLINPDAFLIHHGFKTGVRVRGDHNIQGGWNSIEMSERTNQALIRKHGFKDFIKTYQGLDYSQSGQESIDLEGDIVRSYLNGEVKILEL